MEEVDGIILSMLRTVGCDVDESVKHVSELEASTVVEGVVRCVWLINPSSNIASYQLSPSMATKFRQATDICGNVKDLGYKNEIGYETLLYGNEYDTRKLLLFLSDKLPSEVSDATSKELSPLQFLRDSATKSFSRNMQGPWIPHFCRRLNLHWNGRFWCPPDLIESIAFESHPLPSSFHFSTTPIRHIPASVIASSSSQSQKGHVNEIDAWKYLLQSSSSNRRARLKPKLAAKPKLPPKPGQISISQTTPTTQIDGGITLDEELQTKLANLLQLVEESERIRVNQQQQFTQMSRELDNVRASGADCAETLKQKLQISMMLKDPDAFCDKLQNFIATSSMKMEKIGAKSLEAKQERLNIISAMNKEYGVDNETGRLTLDLEDMNKKLVDIEEELSIMQDAALQLQTERDKLTVGVNRSAYTKRILEIVESVGKQREAIEKVLNDTREVQKDINGLNGRLDRSFIAADEVLLKNAQTDSYSKRAYKMVSTFRDECRVLGNVMEDTGHLQREMQELQDQIEVESQKKIGDQLNRLVSDYCLIRQENENIQAKLDNVHSQVI